MKVKNQNFVNEFLYDFYKRNKVNKSNTLKNDFIKYSSQDLSSKNKNPIKLNKKNQKLKEITFDLYNNANPHLPQIELNLNSHISKSLKFLNEKNKLSKDKKKKYIKNMRKIKKSHSNNSINVPMNNNINENNINENNIIDKNNNNDINDINYNLENENENEVKNEKEEKIKRFTNSQIELKNNIFIPGIIQEREKSNPTKKIYKITSILPSNNFMFIENKNQISQIKNQSNDNNYRLKDLQSMFNYINNLNSNFY